ncbi:hypothetical protein C8R43DRAFT_1134639 [Mycena crocata]|nr:hypothetical protein C8R43DRAFT_1134639 [Mycena crocata]
MLIGNMHLTSSSSGWYKIPRSWRRWLFVKEHRFDPGFLTSLTNPLERTGMAMGFDRRLPHTAERFAEVCLRYLKRLVCLSRLPSF